MPESNAVLESVDVLGDYWRPESRVRTEIGELVHRAKDHRDNDAANELAGVMAAWAADLFEPMPPMSRLVTAVPALTARSAGAPCEGAAKTHLPTLLAAAIAGACVGTFHDNLVIRTNPGPKLRHLPPGQRARAAAAAGYEATELAAGADVVLVDDVVLTGATLREVARQLHIAGARRVRALVAARTRLLASTSLQQ